MKFKNSVCSSFQANRIKIIKNPGAQSGQILNKNEFLEVAL